MLDVLRDVAHHDHITNELEIKKMHTVITFILTFLIFFAHLYSACLCYPEDGDVTDSAIMSSIPAAILSLIVYVSIAA